MTTHEKAPAFQFYPRDFVGDFDVAAMSLEEAGAYAILLCYAWLKDGLPADHAKLARALHVSPGKFARLWAVVGEKFLQTSDGRLRNSRQEEERAAQLAHRVERSESGRKGSSKRWTAIRSVIAEPSLSQSLSDENRIAKHSSSSASASSVQTPSVSMHTPSPVAVLVQSPKGYRVLNRSHAQCVVHSERLCISPAVHQRVVQRIGSDEKARAWYPTLFAGLTEADLAETNDFKLVLGKLGEHLKRTTDQAESDAWLRKES